MNLFNSIIISGLAVLVFCKCSRSKKISYEEMTLHGQKMIGKKIFDAKGELVLDEMLSVDSVNEGVYKEWSAGRLKCVGNYHLGRKHGEWIYMNYGDTERIENWFSGNKFGSQF